MNSALTIDIDFLRLEFAKRLRVLIGNEDRTKNLENFSDKSGISLRQLSQWQNPRHINWPSVPTVIQINGRRQDLGQLAFVGGGTAGFKYGPGFGSKHPGGRANYPCTREGSATKRAGLAGFCVGCQRRTEPC